VIDQEKNYIILQYESILQQLNTEFQKLLVKNKDMEETIQAKDDVLSGQLGLSQDRDEQAKVQRMQMQALEDKNRQMQGELD